MTVIEENLSSFGVVLRTFRKRRHLTQQQLAEVIGVHRSTLINWEQGDFLPGSKTLVLELARHLKLDDQETRQLLEASLTALAPHWLVPLPRNLFFTGREAILEALHTQLGVNHAIALTQSSALHGLGGIGKTQIALEYAYRHALEYSAVFWIGAETDEQVISSLLRIAEVLQLPEQKDKDQQRVVTATQRWFSTHGQWLLIWDNVEDLAILDRFLPSVRSGAILITTRCQTLGTFARGLDLLPMEHEEGMLFLLRRAKVLAPEATHEQVRQLATRMPVQYRAAEELLKTVGGLPLALDQTGAYLEATQCGLSAYLELFRTRHAALLKQRGESSRDHPESVSTTFTLAITATAQRHPAVWDLLRVCALLQPDAIPEELFRQGGEHLGATLQAVCHDVLEWDRVVGIVCASSLLTRQSEGQTLSLHRLVQAVQLDTMTEAEQELWNKRTIEALDAVFPRILASSEDATRRQCNRLSSHTLLCLRRTGTTEKSLSFASLASKMAEYLRECGQYAEAETFSQRALSIREQVLAPDHPDLAYSLNGLAIIYWYQGKYEQAEPLYQRAVDIVIKEQAPGPGYYDIASPLNNLANLYFQQGKYEQAETFYQRALHTREQVFGPAHPRLIYPLNGLANLYSVQGKYEQAEPLYLRAMHIGEQELGMEHPQVAYPITSLANLYTEQGKYKQAESLYQRALHIREQALDPNHPCIAESLYGLAYLFQEQDEYTEAGLHYQRALSIWEQALGQEHPYVASALHGLANLARSQGQDSEAEALYQRTLSIRKQHLDQQHPEIAETLHDLALFRLKQRKLSEALSLAERALQILSQSLGDTHLKTIAMQALYTQLVQEQAEAEKTVSEQDVEEIPDARSAERLAGESSHPLNGGVGVSFSENNPLQEFLKACCELHPRAWCRSADLWQAYEHWAEEHQERYPLSREAFLTQVKAHGCRTDRTKAMRIWRGITLVKKNDDGR
jgi:tetratricopeptide (TPR) repeat protein/DNA-binding XRE family transcriptional regulator